MLTTDLFVGTEEAEPVGKIEEERKEEETGWRDIKTETFQADSDDKHFEKIEKKKKEESYLDSHQGLAQWKQEQRHELYKARANGTLFKRGTRV